MDSINLPNLVNSGGTFSMSGNLGKPQSVNVQQNQNAGSTPSWLQPNFGELQSQYQNMGSNVEGVVNPLRSAFQQTLNYNTSMGSQAANNAAQEYATRAAQAGGSALGAGVVKAQSLLPVFQQNATARQQEANTEAGYKMQGLQMQAGIANQLAQLRNSYSGTLANYMTQQRGQDISMAQGNQQASLTMQGQGVQAAQTLLNSKQPYASYQTDALSGRITSGQDSYNNYLKDQQQRAQAKAYLAQLGM